VVPDEEAMPTAEEDATQNVLAVPFVALGDDHEDTVRKQRVHRKRAIDSAFKARRSSRLASKEPDNFVNMLSKAKAVKTSRFNLSAGSPHLRAAALDAGFGTGMVDPIPLPQLWGPCCGLWD
jgi:hypothetical protein